MNKKPLSAKWLSPWLLSELIWPLKGIQEGGRFDKGRDGSYVDLM